MRAFKSLPMAVMRLEGFLCSKTFHLCLCYGRGHRLTGTAKYSRGPNTTKLKKITAIHERALRSFFIRHLLGFFPQRCFFVLFFDSDYRGQAFPLRDKVSRGAGRLSRLPLPAALRSDRNHSKNLNGG